MPIHRPRISPEDWKRHEAKIKDLYYGQGLPLQSKAGKRNLVQVMRDEHNFSATPSQYEAQFNKWDSSKNVKKGEWKLILAQIDQLRSQNIEIRVRISGQIITKDRLKRARRYVRAELNGSCVPSSSWLSMPEYCHISMEVQGADGEWSTYSPCDSLELARDFDRPASQSHDSILDPTMEDVMQVSTDLGDLVDGQNAMSRLDWSTFPMEISPWRIGTSLPISPGTIFSSAIELQCGVLETPRALANMPEILSQPPPSYQLDLNAPSHLNQIAGTGHPRITGAGFIQVSRPVALSLPSSRHFISLLLQDATIAQQDTWLWPEDIRLPITDEVMDCLQYLLPESLQQIGTETSPEVALGRTNFEQNFTDIMMYSIANGFAGFRGVPIGSIFRLLRSQPQMSSKLLEYLQKCPAILARSLTDNLFRAAIEACDAQAVNTIIQIVKDKINAIDPDEIVCEFQNTMFTPLELAAKLRSTEIVQILLKLGADVNKTYQKNEIMERGPLELAIRRHATSYEPVDLSLVRALLDAGAEVRRDLMRSVARWGTDPELQSGLVERISPNVHRGFIIDLPYLTKHLENNQAFRLTRQLFRFCEETKCSRCITLPNDVFLGNRKFRLLLLILVQAAVRGNLALCEFLLNYTGVEDVALSAAIFGGDRAIIDLVVQHGAGVQGEAARLNRYSVWEDEAGVLFVSELAVTERNPITTPLAEAIRSSDRSSMLLVERLGAWNCVNQPSHLEAAISAAVDANDTNTVARLLSNESSLRGENYTTALIQAIRQHNTPVASMLLAAGVDCRETSDFEKSPLCEALKQQNATILKIILDSDAPIYIDTGTRCSPMEFAGLWGDVSIIKDLIYMGFPMDDGFDTTALAAAVRSGNADLVDLLLTSGADPSASAIKGISPLHEAVHNADGKMIQHLLSNGANSADSEAFIEAIEQQKDCLATLLRAFTNRYLLGCKGFGADLLIKAIETDDRELFQAFITAKLDIKDFSSSRNCTPLGFSIRHQGGNDLDSVRYLLAAGVSVNAIAAAPFGRVTVYGHLVGPQETALLVAIGTRNEKMVNFILENGGDINQAARRGVKRTPLQRACEIGSFKIVKLLLERGANINDPPSRRGGGTALQLASGTGSISIVRLLLTRGAEIHASTSDVEGRSALEAAAENGCIDMLKVLWDATYGVGFQTSEVERAVKFAEKKGHRGCAEYIRELQAASDWVLRQSSALAGIP